VGVVFDAMATRLREQGGQIRFGTVASEIRHDGRRVHEVEVRAGDEREVLSCDVVVSTVPIPPVVNALRPSPDASLLTAANKLIYRSLILTMVVVDRANVTGEMMVYLLDPGFHSNRIGEQKNLDPTMIPADQTVLCFEFCVNERGGDWELPDYHYFNLAREDLERLGVVGDSEVSACFVRRLPEAYPVYNLDFHEHLGPALAALTDLDNLVPLGRQGLFIHNDIHDSMMMAVAGVKHVLSGASREAWKAQVKAFLSWRLE
jgi:protoporphyrinogen oxidase